MRLQNMPTLKHVKCGSTDVRATGSTQFRKYKGKLRLHADMECNNCKQTWWSVHPEALAQARTVDADRKRNLSQPEA